MLSPQMSHSQLYPYSNVATDKKCFGVISASEDPESRQDRYGNIVSVFEKEKGDTRVYINSVGEGAIWVYQCER